MIQTDTYCIPVESLFPLMTELEVYIHDTDGHILFTCRIFVFLMIEFEVYLCDIDGYSVV